MAIASATAELTLGPVLFNWPAERWRDFYFRIADEAPVSTVYVGETVCSKRAPLFDSFFSPVVDRLIAAGKTVVISTLAEVTTDKDRQCVEAACAADGHVVEANDASALYLLKGRRHHIGPFVNTYNEASLAFLMRNGACNFCLPPEMPGTAIRSLCASVGGGATIEVLVFGRLPLALSARCYHARAHGRTKDSCQFICENDLDGLELRTLRDQPFLAVNGIQTLSQEYLNMAAELAQLCEFGVSRFRLSPHTCDMVQIASAFRRVLDRQIDGSEAVAELRALMPGVPFCDGFFFGRPGYSWKDASAP